MRRGSRKNRLLDYWAGIPLLNTLATVRRRRKWPRQIERIGLICSPALGDTLLFSAVATDVRRYFSAPELIHFCMPQNLAAAELIAGIDRRVVIELTNPADTIRRMRAERLDLILDFSSWQRLTAFYSMMSGARFSAGFSTKGQYRGRGYDVNVEHRNDRHEVENFRALLRALDLPAGAEPQVVIPELKHEPLAGEMDVVIFHPWASGQRSWLREWPEKRWVELAHAIVRPGTLLVITGAPGDVERSERLMDRMGAEGVRAVCFISPDGFVSLAHLLIRARVVISVNTGVMHLAAIVGAATVSINGPNRNSRWGPIGPFAQGVEAPGEGCGYLHLGFNFDGQATDCMERTGVEMVALAAEDVERQRLASYCEVQM